MLKPYLNRQMELKLLKGKKLTYLIVAFAAGIILIVLSGSFNKPKSKPPPVAEKTAAPEVGATEKRLEEIIGTVKGVSDVTVFITYENTGVRNTARLTEDTHSQDGQKSQSTRKDNPVIRKESSLEEPFVYEEILPQVRGVIISARGVSDPKTSLVIADAVASALGVPVYKVRVLSKD